jgi:hypothetical protein
VAVINFGNQRLSVPVVLFFEEKLSVDSGDGLRAIGLKFINANSMTCRAHAKRGFTDLPGWILEVDGRFREFVPRGRRKAWAAPLSFLVQLVESEYAVTDAQNISVRDLKQKLDGVVDDFEEAPQAQGLREHLQKYDDDEVVSERMLREWPI